VLVLLSLGFRALSLLTHDPALSLFWLHLGCTEPSPVLPCRRHQIRRSCCAQPTRSIHPGPSTRTLRWFISQRCMHGSNLLPARQCLGTCHVIDISNAFGASLVEITGGACSYGACSREPAPGSLLPSCRGSKGSNHALGGWVASGVRRRLGGWFAQQSRMVDPEQLIHLTVSS